MPGAKRYAGWPNSAPAPPRNIEENGKITQTQTDRQTNRHGISHATVSTFGESPTYRAQWAAYHVARVSRMAGDGRVSGASSDAAH